MRTHPIEIDVARILEKPFTYHSRQKGFHWNVFSWNGFNTCNIKIYFHDIFNTCYSFQTLWSCRTACTRRCSSPRWNKRIIKNGNEEREANLRNQGKRSNMIVGEQRRGFKDWGSEGRLQRGGLQSSTGQGIGIFRCLLSRSNNIISTCILRGRPNQSRSSGCAGCSSLLWSRNKPGPDFDFDEYNHVEKNYDFVAEFKAYRGMRMAKDITRAVFPFRELKEEIVFIPTKCQL